MRSGYLGVMANRLQKTLDEDLPPPLKPSVGLGEKPRTHGGDNVRGRRKIARPVVLRFPIHLRLKSSRARSGWNLNHRKHRAKVGMSVFKYAKRFNCKVLKFVNLGSEIQIILRAATKQDLQNYLRTVAGRVAITATGAERLVKKVGKFWDHLVWSKILSWGREFHEVCQTLENLALPDSVWDQVDSPERSQGSRWAFALRNGAQEADEVG